MHGLLATASVIFQVPELVVWLCLPAFLSFVSRLVSNCLPALALDVDFLLYFLTSRMRSLPLILTFYLKTMWIGMVICSRFYTIEFMNKIRLR
jgi:hypothetical protein